MNIETLILLVFLGINIFIGAFVSRGIKKLSSFSIGKRSFGTFAIFASLTASFIGGGYTIGNAAKVYQYSMMYSFALIGFSLKEILVGIFIAPRMKQYLHCLSVGDIIATHYGKKAQIATGIFSVLLCVGILGAQVSAMDAIFDRFFDMPSIMGVILGFIVIVAYCSLGGMKAVVYTDVIQFLMLIIGIPLVLFIGVKHVGGFEQLFQQIPKEKIMFIEQGSDWFLFLSLFLSFMLGEIFVPPYVQRLFMTKHTKHTKRATILSGIASIPIFIIIGAIGLVAYLLNQTINPNETLPFVINETLSPALKGFIVASLIAVIMSTASSFLNAASVALTNDIIKQIKPQVSEERLLSIARYSTLFFALGAIVFALSINNVLDVLLFSYRLWSPIILVPFLACIFGFKVSNNVFFYSAVGGLAGMLIWSIALNTPFQISSIIVGIITSFVLFSISYSNNLKRYRNKI